jgi:hypothetical protein
MRALTVRDVDDQRARALERAKKRRGGSLNQTVIQLLRQALGLDAAKAPTNGLARLAGTWSEAESMTA